AVDREGGGAVRDRAPTGRLLDQRHRSRQVCGELVARLPEDALVREAVRGRLVAARRDLPDELRVALDRHTEEEEGRARTELLEQLEHGVRLPLERRAARVPVGGARRAPDELMPVLEVDAEEKRRIRH